MNAVTYYGELVERVYNHVTNANMFLVQSLVTCSALFWLLHRAWLTLWKPVPELISILGVEVPDSPAVSLAGIKADAITLHWTRPGPNKPVVRYLIQVNGVNVGESSRNETAITVTGLKPGHFYNVRVIAVGPNNFQAGSSVIRLRTYGRDGRPQLPNGRVPSNMSIEEQQNGALADSSDESSGPRSQSVGIEAVAVPGDPPAMHRESSGGVTGRRNTGGRKHSPSNAAADQAAITQRISTEPEESMQQLTEKFETIRKEVEDSINQMAKDTEEHKSQMLELAKERDEKRQILKEKEEASERLKKEVNSAERLMRQAQTRKSQKDKVLRDKQAEVRKMQEDMVKWKQEVEKMIKQQEAWEEEKEKMAAGKEKETARLLAILQDIQVSVSGLDEDIKIKRLQIKELEEERKQLPGGQDDEESRERDALAAQQEAEWESKEREIGAQLSERQIYLRQIRAQVHTMSLQWNGYNTIPANAPVMYHGNSSGVDFDVTGGQSKPKSRRSRNRKSRTSTLSSPIAAYPITDSQFSSGSGFPHLNTTASPSYAPGLYFENHDDSGMVPISAQFAGMSDADVTALTAGAPLSPSATSLIPMNLLDDNDPPSPRAGSTGSFGPGLYEIGTSQSNDVQTPESSSRSASLISSPRTSSQNLALYGVTPPSFDHGDTDRRSLTSARGDRSSIGSPHAAEQLPAQRRLGKLLGFPRARGKTMQGDGPLLGSLNKSQSHSFPRSTEEPGTTPVINRPRRMSFSSTFSLFKPVTVTETSEGNAPAPARNTTRRRGFNMFSSSLDESSPRLSDHIPSSPRPLSTASSDLPRPSTDSAPFGWPTVEGAIPNRNSPLGMNWPVNTTSAWSRNPSRRPSFQHGSTTALVSGIASEDDDFLPQTTLHAQSSPPPAPIGTRPPSSHKPNTPKLNPAAPAFSFPAIFGRSSKVDKTKTKEKTVEILEGDNSSNTNIPSSADSRKSRDTPSIRTQNSMAESRESLERTTSNTPSDMAAVSASSSKDKESAFRQLLRKGSSSKFSISSIRGKDSALFGGKKPSSSVTNSDRNASVERDGSFDEYGEDALGRSVDSMTGSPMIPSNEWKGRDSATGTPKEGRMNITWGRFGLKSKEKVKTRESLDVDRSEAETTGPEDEGRF